MTWNERIQQELQDLQTNHLYRDLFPRQGPADRRVKIQGQSYLNFSSNDYLGLANHPEINQRATIIAQKWGNGSGGSRLLGGDTQLAHDLEKRIAQSKNFSEAILFNSGFQANLALGSALGITGTRILADRLIHASMIDGIRLGSARLLRYNHLDPQNLDELMSRHPEPKIVMTESVFSMDGDLAPLAEILQICRRHQALLIVDEAHADGVLGIDGHGLCSELDLKMDDPILILSTFGKAYGCCGAAISGSTLLIQWLRQKARSFIYSTAFSPWNMGAIDAALDLAQSESWRRAHVLQLAHLLRQGLQKQGWDTMNSQSPILPILVGSTEKCMQMAQDLRKQGFWIQGIRPPTVPQDQARLRINLCAFHQPEDLYSLLNALESYSCP